MSQVNVNIDLQSDSIQINPPVDSRILSHHDVSQNSGVEMENMVPLKIGSTENVFQGAVSTEDTEDTEYTEDTDNTVDMEERNLADALVLVLVLVLVDTQQSSQGSITQRSISRQQISPKIL